jgi:hypothetical protein
MAAGFSHLVHSREEIAWAREERMRSVLGTLDKFFDKLPLWAKLAFFVLTIVGSVYYIARYGLGSFLLHAIFSP